MTCQITRVLLKQFAGFFLIDVVAPFDQGIGFPRKTIANHLRQLIAQEARPQPIFRQAAAHDTGTVSREVRRGIAFRAAPRGPPR